MTGTKEQQKQANQIGTTKANNSRNESLIQHLSEEDQYRTLKELLREVLPVDIVDTLQNFYYADNHLQLVGNHANEWFSDEIFFDIQRIKKNISKESFEDFQSRFSKRQATLESLTFMTDTFRALVHSLYNDDFDSPKFEN